MKSRRPGVTLPWVVRAAAGLAALAGGEKAYAVTFADLDAVRDQREGLGRYAFGYDHVLGTSLDLVVEAGRPADARHAREAIFSEIDRLSAILSTYDVASEISRVRRGAPIASRELTEVLEAYARWAEVTGGAIDSGMAEVVALWKQAAVANRLPDRAALAAAARVPRAYNVDALGKAYIVEKAVASARRFAPSGLLNIGGDIRVWGGHDWAVGVANPAEPADNAGPVALVRLREGAIATSGGYARFLTVAGQRYSHLVDPRTQWALPTGRGATFVAADAVTANALATAASIVGAEAARPFAALPGVSGSLVVDGSRVVSATGSLAGAAASRPQFAAVPAAAEWPRDFQVQVDIKLKNPAGGGDPFGGRGGRGPGGPGGGRGGAKRPYVVVWVEDDAGRLVRSVTLWAGEPRYYSELTAWWSKIRGNMRAAQAMSRATRAPGAYTVTWDGRDDAGKPVPRGTYKIMVEISREHGSHVTQSAVIDCGSDPVSADLKVTSESDAGKVAYGPKAP